MPECLVTIAAVAIKDSIVPQTFSQHLMHAGSQATPRHPASFKAHLCALVVTCTCATKAQLSLRLVWDSIRAYPKVFERPFYVLHLLTYQSDFRSCSKLGLTVRPHSSDIVLYLNLNTPNKILNFLLKQSVSSSTCSLQTKSQFRHWSLPALACWLHCMGVI
jgi:hypothetical protein